MHVMAGNSSRVGLAILPQRIFDVHNSACHWEDDDRYDYALKFIHGAATH